jgi:hypothetical protein
MTFEEHWKELGENYDDLVPKAYARQLWDAGWQACESGRNEVEDAKEKMRQRLVVCDEVQTPHSYALCSCAQGHKNPRIADDNWLEKKLLEARIEEADWFTDCVDSDAAMTRLNKLRAERRALEGKS